MGTITRYRLVCGLSVLAIIAIGLHLSGCGGDGGGGNGGEPPGGGTATITGIVVDATNVGVRIPNADVEVVSTTTATAAEKPSGLSDTTGSQGEFDLTEVPGGTVVLDIGFPLGGYQSMQITVQTLDGKTTYLNIAAVPSTSSAPTQVTISPSSAQVDIGGEVLFQADVRSLGVPLNQKPSFSLIGSVGTLLPSGLFTGTGQGTGTVTAIIASGHASAGVQVTGTRPPRLGTLAVSPTGLPAEGGDIRIAVAATDGSGIESVTAEIERPNRSLSREPLSLETGNDKDGSWGTSVHIDANDNPTDPDGKQLPQTYSVRVVAEDKSSDTTTSGWVDVSVAGLDNPPGPPGQQSP